MEGKKILFISTNLYPVRGGDTIYSAGIVYRLAENNELTLITLGDNKGIDNADIFKKVHAIFSFPRLKGKRYSLIKLIFNRSLLQDYSYSAKKFLKKNDLDLYDLIVIDHLRAYSICKPIFAKKLNKAIITYVAHNVESINQKEKLDLLPNKRFLSSLSNNVFEIEKSILNKCDTIWALNENDLKTLTRDHHKNNAVIKPYYPWKRVKSIQNLKTNTNELLILGSLNWYPNIQGIVHFVKNIFPKVIASNNDVKLNIVGQNPSNEILGLVDSRIKVFPNVVSVDPYILRSDLLIIPNRSGTGSKIKLLESISKGLPVITYPDNIVGYENLKISKPFLVYNEDEFADSIIKILKKTQLKAKFIEENLRLLEENKLIKEL